MEKASYYIETGEADRLRLETLNKVYNPTTQAFLRASGLCPGMTALEVGCGTGHMACWIAEQVGPKGKVVAIDNSEDQLVIARQTASSLGVKNIEFKLHDVADVASLNMKFDFIYGRWVLIFFKNGLEYADRLSVFWSSYDKDTFGEGIGRFPPIDRLDFIRYGVLITGVDRRAELPLPEHKDIVLASAKFITSFMLAGEKFDKLTRHPEKIIAEGARYLTKFVLFPVRLIFTLDHPGVIGSNKDAVEHFNNKLTGHLPEATEMVNMAYTLRNTPVDSVPAIAPDKLHDALLPLYAYCISRYQDAAAKLGDQKLAAQLASEEKRLQTAINVQN